jgi:hypothetical protein
MTVISSTDKATLERAAAIVISVGADSIEEAILRLEHEPEIFKTVILAVSHLPPEIIDPDWMATQDGVVVEQHPSGWWLFTDKDTLTLGDAVDPRLVDVIRRAQELGCGWVRFDQQGPTDPYLPTWRW